MKAKSEASKEDNLNQKQAMNGPFNEEYWKATVKELKILDSMDAWEVVDRLDDANIIDSIWAFRLKCYLDKMPNKLKARFCAQGDQRLEGIVSLKHTCPWFSEQWYN